MDNIAGPPVEGSNFFGREAVVDYFRDQLNSCDILLLGPRRIGKTSTARAVMAAVRKQGWQTFEINVASCVSERMSDRTADEAKRTFIRLRDILLRDAYWQANETETGKRYRFCLEPLRRWWVRRDTL